MQTHVWQGFTIFDFFLSANRITGVLQSPRSRILYTCTSIISIAPQPLIIKGFWPLETWSKNSVHNSSTHLSINPMLRTHKILQTSTTIYDSAVKSLPTRQACLPVGARPWTAPWYEREVGRSPTGTRISGRIVGVRSTEQSGESLLTVKSFICCSDYRDYRTSHLHEA